MSAKCSLNTFWRSQPVLWFLQREALFSTHNVMDDTAQYHLAIGAIDPATLEDLQNVIANLPSTTTDKYKTLKEAIIKRTTESPDSKLLKLLTNLELGDSKPSQLWRKMKSMAGDKILDPALKVMWLALLPKPAQTYLSVFKIDEMEDLLEAADKLITHNMQVSSVSTTENPSNNSSGYCTPVCPVSSVQQQLAALQPAVTQLIAITKSSIERAPQAENSQRGRGRACSKSRQRTAAGKTPAENRLFIEDPSTSISFLVDTGSVVSLIPKTHVNRSLEKQLLMLHAANQTRISTYGKEQLEVIIVDIKEQRIIDAKTLLSMPSALDATAVRTVSTIEAIQQPDGPLAKRYQALMKEFEDVFGDITPACILSMPVKHVINTTGPPVAERPGSGKWASPLYMVPKKKGWRAAGDYRGLNAITIPDRYPLPIILQSSPGNVFSTVDLENAFYQIPIDEDNIEKTVVTTPFGLFEFLGTSLGLKNATQTMQQAMDLVLRKLPFAKFYVDDIFIASKDHEEHLQHLRQLLEALRQAKLKVSKESFQPPSAKVEAIKSYPLPNTATELRRFLGIHNYYRRCLPHAARNQAPLHDLLKGLSKKAKLKCTP
ncbi:hypothetical protein TSAR_004976 [Trichomalopsis sarcophagae]|uniref:Uncharacterized protein n=1 Tax=Trichomalopsis sarcophagae TaxID=543379 RepID=A0A232EEI1_9HYME|nr:hypothetical protein TSAR_004976 [Trichomalopsis sarcophagae]